MKCIVQLSGGLDSTAVLLTAALLREPHALFVDYGQATAKQERAAASSIAAKVGVTLHEVQLRGLAFASSGDYIPVRNFVLGAIAGNLAAARGAEEVWVGNKTLAHRPNDPWCWKDCTRAFYDSLTNTARECFESGTPTYVMPLAGMTRAEVKRLVNDLGKKHGIDASATWSCYVDGAQPCGTCFHCKEGNDA